MVLHVVVLAQLRQSFRRFILSAVEQRLAVVAAMLHHFYCGLGLWEWKVFDALCDGGNVSCPLVFLAQTSAAAENNDGVGRLKY